MKELELFEETLKLKYMGQEIILSYPSVHQFEKYQEKLVKGGTEISMAREFLVELGMSEEIAKSLQMNNMRLIIEELIFQKKR